MPVADKTFRGTMRGAGGIRRLQGGEAADDDELGAGHEADMSEASQTITQAKSSIA